MATQTVVPPPRERMKFRRRPGKKGWEPPLPLPGLAGERPYRCENGSESLEGVADDGDRMYAELPLCFRICRVRGAIAARSVSSSCPPASSRTRKS